MQCVVGAFVVKILQCSVGALVVKIMRCWRKPIVMDVANAFHGGNRFSTFDQLIGHRSCGNDDDEIDHGLARLTV